MCLEVNVRRTERNIMRTENNTVTSVSNDNSEHLRWFALWVYRNLTAPVAALCRREGIEHYIPMRMVERFVNGGVEYGEEPVISGLMFVRTTVGRLNDIQHATANRAIPYRQPGSSEPAPVDDRSMEIFMFVTRTGARQAEAVELELAKGDKVRVTEGLFKGAEGYIRRIHGTKRFVVALEGIAAIAVTHVPRQFLEKACEAAAAL